MQSKFRAYLLFTLSFGVLTACGPSVSDPSEANFRNALNTYFSKMKECIAIGNKPDGDGVIRAFRADGKGFGMNEKGLFDALAVEGLLETARFKKELPNFSGTEMIDLVGYNVSVRGESFLRPAEYDEGTFAMGAPQFCYAYAEVIDITNFTEPVPVVGVMAVNVKFTYHLVDVAPWADNPALAKKFEWVKERITAATIDGNEDLILTNAGWMHHSEVKQ